MPTMCSAASAANARPQIQAPLRPLQWKADGQGSDSSLPQLAVQERKLLIRRHPSSGCGGGLRAGGCLVSLKRLHMAHSWLTLTRPAQRMYSRSRSRSSTFISGIILLNAGACERSHSASPFWGTGVRESLNLWLGLFPVSWCPLIKPHTLRSLEKGALKWVMYLTAEDH